MIFCFLLLFCRILRTQTLNKFRAGLALLSHKSAGVYWPRLPRAPKLRAERQKYGVKLSAATLQKKKTSAGEICRGLEEITFQPLPQKSVHWNRVKCLAVKLPGVGQAESRGVRERTLVEGELALGVCTWISPSLPRVPAQYVESTWGNKDPESRTPKILVSFIKDTKTEFFVWTVSDSSIKETTIFGAFIYWSARW